LDDEHQCCQEKGDSQKQDDRPAQLTSTRVFKECVGSRVPGNTARPQGWFWSSQCHRAWQWKSI